MTSKIDINNQKEQIIRMRSNNYSRQQIGEILGISQSSLNRRISELLKDGLIKPIRYESEYQNEHIIKWHNEGISQKEISKRLGMTIAAVETRIKKLRGKGYITTYNKSGPKKQANSSELSFNISNNLSLEQMNTIAHIYLEQKQYNKLIKLLEMYSANYSLSENNQKQILIIINKLQKKAKKEKEER
ncbi:MAG: winged helix-turn-helix transcriptional regulator [Clostridia bacterium]|nr:winged helix-turn-helix transcriptional regulator [Clostridia bacterium]